MVGNADVAVKTYHTSAPVVPEQLLETVGLEIVALSIVPAVMVHEVPGVKVTAPEQLSFVGGGGGSVTQISKLQLLPVGEVVSE